MLRGACIPPPRGTAEAQPSAPTEQGHAERAHDLYLVIIAASLSVGAVLGATFAPQHEQGEAAQRTSSAPEPALETFYVPAQIVNLATRSRSSRTRSERGQALFADSQRNERGPRPGRPKLVYASAR